MKSLLLCWQTDAMLKVYTKLFRYLSQVMKKKQYTLVLIEDNILRSNDFGENYYSWGVYF